MSSTGKKTGSIPKGSGETGNVQKMQSVIKSKKKTKKAPKYNYYSTFKKNSKNFLSPNNLEIDHAQSGVPISHSPHKKTAYSV